MTKLMEKAIRRVKQLSNSRQDEFGQMILDVVEQQDAGAQLTPSQQEEVRRRMTDLNPVIASDAQVEALFRKFAV